MTTKRHTTLLAVLLLAATSGCSDRGDPPDDPSVSGAARDSASRATLGRIYEQRIVFVPLGSNPAVIVPVFFSARTVPGGVIRSARGWLTQGDDWETFFEDRWQGPPTRAPWRPLPRRSLRLVVGEGDVLESVVYEEGSQLLELDLEAGLVEWTGPEGDALRLHEGGLRFGGQQVPGVVMEMNRVRPGPEPTAGDWAFLISGDSLAVLLESPRQAEAGARGAFVGFGRLDFQDLRWPEVTVDWAETRSYEPARRDIPMSWVISSPGAEIRGGFEVSAAWLEAGDGEGPVLPVEALYAVSGELRVDGRAYPATGLFRHRRP